jgi:hypothetical protein
MITPKKSVFSPEKYVIGIGTTLYRGDTPFYIRNKDKIGSLVEAPTFFGLIPDDVKQYGIIHSWTATADIELLHLDNPDVLKSIYDKAPLVVQEVLKINYGYDPTNNTIGHSNSIFEKDKIFYDYLCTTGSNGYVSTRSEGEENSSYEVMVCKPTEFKYDGIVFPTDVGDREMYIAGEIAKYKERIEPKEILGKKKRPDIEGSVFSFDESPPKYMAYSPEGDVHYSPLRIPNGRESPVKMSVGTPAHGRSLFDSPNDEKLSGRSRFDSPAVKKGALFSSPGGSKKRRFSKKRKTNRGKSKSYKSRTK